MRDITKSNFEKAESELKKQAESKKRWCVTCEDWVHTMKDGIGCSQCWNPTLSAEEKRQSEASLEIRETEADLKDFSLTDAGNYLIVSHKALHDAAIGIVSKNEYENGNKEAILRSVLEASFAPYFRTDSLKITGSFVAPTINPAPVEEVIVIPVEKKASEEKQIEPAKEITSDLPLLRSADSFRQNIERSAAKEQEAFNRFITSTVNDLASYVRSLRYDDFKVVEAIDPSSLSLNDGGVNGHLVVAASLLDSSGPRLLNIPVPVTASKAVFPNSDEMKDLVNKSVNLQSKLIEELVKDATAGMDRVDAEVAYNEAEAENIINEKTAELTKTASDNQNTQDLGDTETLTVQKHLLPNHEDYKEGDHISDGNTEWEIYDMHSQQNSKGENDGSLWKLRKCAPPKSQDKPPTDVKMPL